MQQLRLRKQKSILIVFIVCVQKIYFVLSFQLLLVSGGLTGSDEYTSTTELYNGAIWFNVGKLPWGMRYFPIINIDNRILAFGRRHLVRFYCKFLSLVLKINIRLLLSKQNRLILSLPTMHWLLRIGFPPSP